MARGASWNQELKLVGNGTSSNWNAVGAYGTGANPKILRNNNEADRGIRMVNPSYWQVSDLEVGNAGNGILVYFDTKSHQGLKFSNLYLHHNAGIDRGNTASSLADHIYFSAGINFTGHFTSMASNEYAVKDITMNDIEGTHNNNTINFDWENGSAPGSWPAPQTAQNIHMYNLYMHDDDGAGRSTSCSNSLGLIDVSNVKIINANLNNEAACYASQGTAAVFFGLVSNVEIMNSMVTNTPETGSNDQTAFDYEVGTNQVNIRNSYIAGNAGAGIEVLNIHSGVYYTNSTISGNVFEQNNSSNHFGSSVSSILVYDTKSPTPTGTIRDNLYYEPGRTFASASGGASLSGFTLSNNKSINASSSLYFSAKDFNGTQGGNGWSYQSFNGSSWSNLAYYDSANKSWQPSSSVKIPQVTPFNVAPDSCSGCKIARVWTAPSTGVVSIRGRVLKADLGGGDGVTARITNNGTRIWPASGDQSIAWNDDFGAESNLDNVSVSAGDVIRFEVNQNTNNANDLTSWVPSIAYTSIGTATNALSNAGFEAPSTSTLQYGPMTNGWTFDANGAGVQRNGSIFGAASAPEGVQTAFIQNVGQISQALNFTAGTYTVGFKAAKRTSFGGTESFDVYFDSTLIGSFSPSSGSFTSFTTNSFTATAGSHTVKFAGTASSGDNTAFIDDVSISSVTGTSYQASIGYSSTQGSKNWAYQYGNGSSYADMTWDATNSRWNKSGTFSIVSANWQHPDAGADSVRKFTVPQTGSITITGTVKKQDTSGGDGVNVKIMKNGTQIWPASGWRSIAYNDGIGYSVNISTTVTASDTLLFIVNANNSVSYDSTEWDPVITYN
ncbi:hypothetical protein ACFSR7_20515 [Cohnella sp. GCM10020058]|uniref:hypothetical protein n=1 Tax=Cohnella sp. GCM10020058 TaxID=3317330 RepID=UPI00362BA0AD